MFPRRMFPGRYFVPTYFPPVVGESPVPTPRGRIRRPEVPDIAADIAADDEAFFLLFD